MWCAFRGRAPQLYNLETDIGETENVAEARQAIMTELAELLEAERAKKTPAERSN